MTIQEYAAIFIVLAPGLAAVISGLGQRLLGDKGAGKVQADRRRLARAIGHLVDNAIAATPKGGRILVELARLKSGKARIVISDNGTGMDATSSASSTCSSTTRASR